MVSVEVLTNGTETDVTAAVTTVQVFLKELVTVMDK